ncbi:hypothetical protein, partial [Rhizomonospora bruguierae]|uniref:hypothetical protein n=1 Tax=Rhizomonospora bruguierae TaxID=1581705 RepID=UPI001BD06F1A
VTVARCTAVMGCEAGPRLSLREAGGVTDATETGRLPARVDAAVAVVVLPVGVAGRSTVADPAVGHCTVRLPWAVLLSAVHDGRTLCLTGATRTPITCFGFGGAHELRGAACAEPATAVDDTTTAASTAATTRPARQRPKTVMVLPRNGRARKPALMALPPRTKL